MSKRQTSAADASASSAPYPLMLNLAGRLAVVVGAGQVGQRKVRSLLPCGCRVRVVDPRGGKGFAPGVQVFARRYQRRDVRGASLVFACTGDPAVNARVVEDARALGIWVSRADQADEGDFSLPAVHRGEGFLLAVATWPPVPSLATALRDLLAEQLPSELAAFVAELARLRGLLKGRRGDSSGRAALLRRLAGPEGMAAFRAGGAAALERMLNEDRP